MRGALIPKDPSDAYADPDGDGVINLAEYMSNTDQRGGREAQCDDVLYNYNSTNCYYCIILE